MNGDLLVDKNNYVSVVYNEKSHPPSTYPNKLIDYFYKRFNLNKDMIIVDIGTGRGDFLKSFENKGNKCFGIDKDDYTKDCCSKILKCNIENDKFPLDDNSVDLVLCKSVIEHMGDPSNLILQIHRILKPEGKLIMMTPDWQTTYKIFYTDYTHKQPYCKEALDDLLKIFNFKNVETEIFFQLPQIWKHPSLKIFAKILQLFGAPKKIVKNKFFRFCRETMVLGVCRK